MKMIIELNDNICKQIKDENPKETSFEFVVWDKMSQYLEEMIGRTAHECNMDCHLLSE